jgi:hypothetical protein
MHRRLKTRRVSKVSVMPEDQEKQIGNERMADLLTFPKAVR